MCKTKSSGKYIECYFTAFYLSLLAMKSKQVQYFQAFNAIYTKLWKSLQYSDQIHLCMYLQGISHWNVLKQMALRGRRTNNFIRLWCLVASGGLHICVSSTSFQKNDMSWPQQPLTEKVQKFNMIFHDSTQKNIFSKH